MAISKLEKVYLFIPREDKDKVLNVLQKASILHIEDDLRNEIEAETKEREVLSQELDLKISQAQYIIDYLNEFEKQPGLLEQLENTTAKPISYAEFEEISTRINLKDVYYEISDIARARKSLEVEKNELMVKLEKLQPYGDMAVDFSEVKDTSHVRMRVGAVDSRMSPVLHLAFQDVSDLFVYEKIKEAYKGMDYIFLAYHRSCEEEIDKILTHHGYKDDELRIDGTIRENVLAVSRRIEEIDRKRDEVVAESTEKTGILNKVRLMYDFLLSEKKRKEAEGFLYETHSVSIIKGWVRKKNVEKLEKLVSTATRIYNIEYYEPTAVDVIPVEMENCSCAEPGEMLVNLYSLPKYNELDPSALILPFFIFFYSLAIADAGYGILLFITGLVLLKFLPGSKFAKILTWSGAVTIVTGFFMGGFFGIERQLLPEFMRNNSFDLNDNLMYFLVFTLALGVIQIVVGYFVGARMAYINKEWDTFIRKIVLGLLFAAGGPILLANMFLNTTAPLQDILSYIVLGSLGLFVVYQVLKALVSYRHKGHPALIVFAYLGILLKAVVADVILGMIQEGMSFFSNMLSYSRLMALGLAGSSIAMAINMIGGIAYEAIPWRPLAVIMVLIFLVFAQVISFVLSALVGFVHCMRLQYVEFFPYFFEGGGRMFSPLSIKTKYNKVSTD
jgi:V/A-type H+/Na+-transporting ATPase subunit I